MDADGSSDVTGASRESPDGGEPKEPQHVFIGSHLRSEIVHLLLHGGGEVTVVERVPTLPTPRALAWNRRARVLYAANDRSEQLSGFRLETATGRLAPLGSVPSSLPGVWPVSLAIHPNEKWLLVGHYENHVDNRPRHPLSLVPLDDAGRPGSAPVVADELCDDSGTFRVAFDPAGRYAFAACDDDGIYRWAFDPATGVLTPRRFNNVLDFYDETGVVFNDRARAGYFWHSDHSVLVMPYSPEDGQFPTQSDQAVSFWDPTDDTKPRLRFMERPFLQPTVTIDRNGEHLFSANLNQNVIAAIAIDGAGRLGQPLFYRSREDELRRPVHVVKSLYGPWLLVANEETGTVSTFVLESGQIALVGPPVFAVEGASFIAIAD